MKIKSLRFFWDENTPEDPNDYVRCPVCQSMYPAWSTCCY